MADENNKFKFRTDDLERQEKAKFNRENAQKILEQAGIMPDSQNYQQYLALTMRNVHNTGRFGVYNDEVETMFVEMLKNPEMSIDQYRQATEQYYIQVVETQQKNASGSTFSGKDESYGNLKANIDETVKSGIEMRQEFQTMFPKEFYDENGKLRNRIVVDIPLDRQEGSALGMIGSYAHNHDGISFDRENNVIIDNGKTIGPEKFFKGKKEVLDDRFLSKIGKDENLLDMDDKELFDILREGDFGKFQDLRKQRGMAKDKRNEALRTALSDRHVFKDISSRMDIITDKDDLLHQVKDLALDYEAKAQLVRREAEKETLEVIDRVMFTVNPYDVATQSTFRDWKSCMNAVGCNHRYVDDAIGVGSIVAYGYDSKNPQKMVSRLLIHPYTNEKGEVAYKVNPRIYGHENIGFRDIVNDVVKDTFNEGKDGKFVFNRGIFGDDERGKLYNDGGVYDLLLMNADENGFLDLEKYIDYDKYCDLQYSNFENVKKIRVPSNAKISNINLPKGVEIEFDGAVRFTDKIDGFLDLRGVKNVTLSDCTSIGEDVKLPQALNIEHKIPKGINFDGVENLKLCYIREIFEDVKFPKNVSITGWVENGYFEGVENLKLEGDISLGKDVKLPQNVDWSEVSSISGYLPKGCDLSKNEDVVLKYISGVEGDVKLPKKVQIIGSIGSELSFEGVESVSFNGVKEIPEGVKLPKDVLISGNITKGNFEGVENLKFEGDIFLGKDVKLPQNVDWSKVKSISGYLPKGCDLSKNENVVLKDILGVEGDVKLPKKVQVTGNIWSELSFEGVDDLKIDDGAFFATRNDNRNPIIKGEIPDGADLSNLDGVKFTGKVKFGQDIKLPKNVDWSETRVVSGYIPKGSDFSGLKELEFKEKVIFGEGVKIPNTYSGTVLCVGGHIPNGMNFRSLGGDIEFVGDVFMGKDVKLWHQCIKDVSRAKFKGEIVFNEHLREADFSEAESLVFKDGEIFFTDLKFPKNGNVRFEGFVSAKDFESVQKIAEINDSAIVMFEGKNFEGMKVHENITLLTEKDGVSFVVLPKNEVQENKYNILSKINSEFTPDVVKNMEESGGIRFVTQEEFAKETGVIFESNVVKNRENVSQIAKEEQNNGINKIEEEAKASKQKMDDRVDVRAPHKAVSKESVEKVAEEAQKRKGIIDRSIDAVKKFNDRVDDKIGDVIEKGSKALNDTKIGKAYLKSEKAVLDTKAVKGVKGVWNKAGKVIGDSAIAKGFKKAGAKLGGKVAAKVGGKAVVKSVVKKIPIISAAAGLGFAVDRCFKGEWVAAGGELLSGVAGCFPGLGTAASVAIDVGLAANDISNAVNDENKTSSVREHAIAEARAQKSVKDVQKEIAERGEILRQEGRLEGNKGKQAVTPTTLSQEMIAEQNRIRA